VALISFYSCSGTFHVSSFSFLNFETKKLR
jgi:hypothetical protein